MPALAGFFREKASCDIKGNRTNRVHYAVHFSSGEQAMKNDLAAAASIGIVMLLALLVGTPSIVTAYLP